MKTGTLEVINKLWKFREETGNPLFFTLDAGANVHCFSQKMKVLKLLKILLKPNYCNTQKMVEL